MIIHNFLQHSPEWYKIREAKITSTRLNSVIAPKGDRDKMINRLIAEEISGMSDESDYVSDDMQRGIDMEPLARKDYTKTTGREIMEVGFLQSERWPLLGVSADGLVGSDGAVEIKCPDTHTHVGYLRGGIVPKEYKSQTLSYFLVHEDLEWIDFISYDPRFTVYPLFIKRTLRAEWAEEISIASKVLDKFFQDYEEAKESLLFGNIFLASPIENTNALLISK